MPVVRKEHKCEIVKLYQKISARDIYCGNFQLKHTTQRCEEARRSGGDQTIRRSSNTEYMPAKASCFLVGKLSMHLAVFTEKLHKSLLLNARLGVW